MKLFGLKLKKIGKTQNLIDRNNTYAEQFFRQLLNFMYILFL